MRHKLYIPEKMIGEPNEPVTMKMMCPDVWHGVWMTLTVRLPRENWSPSPTGFVMAGIGSYLVPTTSSEGYLCLNAKLPPTWSETWVMGMYRLITNKISVIAAIYLHVCECRAAWTESTWSCANKTWRVRVLQDRRLQHQLIYYLGNEDHHKTAKTADNKHT